MLEVLCQGIDLVKAFSSVLPSMSGGHRKTQSSLETNVL